MNGNDNLSFIIHYTKAAEKFMRTHEDVRKAYHSALEELLFGEHPEQIDVKRLAGKKNDYYRIRIGNWRIVYTVINGEIVVITTVLAGARGDVYKKMGGLK